MAKRVRQHRGWSPRDVDYRTADFEPYALAIGRLALAWNNLHERLAAVFWTLLGAGISWISRWPFGDLLNSIGHSGKC